MFDALIMYDKGEYIIHDGNNNWLTDYGNGSKIIAVNGMSINDTIIDYYERGYLDWDYIRNKHYVGMITPYLFGADAEFTIRNTTGFEKDVTFNTAYYSYPNPWNYPSSRLSMELLNNNETAYIYSGSFDSSYQYLDEPLLRAFYETIDGCNELIIDIRGNGGGSTDYWMNNFYWMLGTDPEMLEAYAAFRTGEYVQYFREANYVNVSVAKEDITLHVPEVLTDDYDLYNFSWSVQPFLDSYEFAGDIKLLIDRNVYSSAESFAVFCKQTQYATVYGTASGGDGIGITPMYYVLPNSKLIIRLPCVLGIDEMGFANEEVRTQPDFIYESTFGNFSELIDYAIKN